MASGINIEHPIAYAHTQNGLQESFIRYLQLVVRPLLMGTTLPNFAWVHVVLHVVALIYIRLTSAY